MSEPVQIIRAEDNSFRVSGELVYATVPDLLEKGRSVLGEVGDVVIDLGGVTRVDSAALALMLEWMSQCHARGRGIRFRNVPQDVVAIADLSNVKELLPLGGD